MSSSSLDVRHVSAVLWTSELLSVNECSCPRIAAVPNAFATPQNVVVTGR